MILVSVNKNNATLTSVNKNGLTGYITTDDSSFILVGENEDLTLIYDAGSGITNITKNNG